MTTASAECKVLQCHSKLISDSIKMCQESVERQPEGECGAFQIGIPPNIPIRPYHQDRNLHDFRKENQDSSIQTLPIEEGILPR